MIQKLPQGAEIHSTSPFGVEAHALRFFVAAVALTIAGYENHGISNEPSAPTAEQLEAEIRGLLVPTNRRDPARFDQVAATIAKTHGPSSVPALDALADLGTTSRPENVRLTALVAIALMSEDKRAFEVMARRSPKDIAKSDYWYLTYMPQERRDALLWELFLRDVDIRDADARARARAAAFMIAELGVDEQLEAIEDRLRLSGDKELRSYIERTAGERRRVQRLVNAPEAKINAWKAEQLRIWIGSVRLHVLPRGTTSARGLPTPYCVARAVSPIQKAKVIDDYWLFCGQGAYWQAIHDLPGLVEIATDAKRPEELRRAAVKILVDAPKLTDDLPKVRRPEPSEIELLADGALDALKDLVSDEGAIIRTWIAEEILAQDRKRDPYRRIMRALAADERLTADLREKCSTYAQR